MLKLEHMLNIMATIRSSPLIWQMLDRSIITQKVANTHHNPLLQAHLSAQSEAPPN